MISKNHRRSQLPASVHLRSIDFQRQALLPKASYDGPPLDSDLQLRFCFNNRFSIYRR